MTDKRGNPTFLAAVARLANQHQALRMEQAAMAMAATRVAATVQAVRDAYARSVFDSNHQAAALTEGTAAIVQATASLRAARVDGQPLAAMLHPDLPLSQARGLARTLTKAQAQRTGLAAGPAARKGRVGPLRDALVELGASVAAEHHIDDLTTVIVDAAIAQARRGVITGAHPVTGRPGWRQGLEIHMEGGTRPTKAAANAVDMVTYCPGAVGPEGEWDPGEAKQVRLQTVVEYIQEGIARYRSAHRG